MRDPASRPGRFRGDAERAPKSRASRLAPSNSPFRPLPFPALSRLVLLVAAGSCLWLLAGLGARPGRVAAASADPVVAAVGDIACDPASVSFKGGQGTSSACRQQYVSNLLVNAGYAAVLALGDNQYYCGGYAAFLKSYDLSWGRLKSITRPAVGNHEYLTSGGTDCNTGAAGYFEYFGSAAGTPGRGYYSFDVGAWHIISLNSSCAQLPGGCGTGSPEYAWLQSDLAAHTNLCTLAYWHIPLYSSGGRASPNMRLIWQLLYDHYADLVLSGHDHIYERFAPQDANGNLDQARGMREFVVGTGGANHTSIAHVAANSQLRNTSTFGVLRLTLHAASYDWKFVPESGATFTDSGSGTCHAAPDTTPPTAPANLSATGVTSSQVSLAWSASSDNVGVAGYKVFRNGVQIATLGATSYADKSVQPQTAYSYYVVAYDAAGLTSQPSNTVSVTTPAAPPLFSDGFESGDLSQWTSALGLVVQSQQVSSGTYAARGTSSAGGPTYARKQLPSAQSALYYRIRFMVISQAANPVSLMKFRTAADGSILSVSVNDLGQLAYRNDIAGTSVSSAQSVAAGSWQTLQAYVQIAGASSQVKVWYNGTPVSALTRTESLGSDPVGRIQLGENTGGLTYDIAFDDVAASTSYIGGTASQVMLTPVADAFVDSSNPGANFGAWPQLRADTSPDVRSFLRFSVPGLAGQTISRARLQLYAQSGSANGITAYSVADNTWGESTITYGSMPALGSSLASSPAAAAGTWITLDVSSYVTAPGIYSFGLTSPGVTAIGLGSREAGLDAPLLDVSP